MRETCPTCKMDAAEEAEGSFWRNDKQIIVQFQCANCGTEFSRLRHKTLYAGATADIFPQDPYDVGNIAAMFPTRSRPSTVSVSRPLTSKKHTSYVDWNRARKTASLKDIKSEAYSIIKTSSYCIREVNLEL